MRTPLSDRLCFDLMIERSLPFLGGVFDIVTQNKIEFD